ncbi:MAG: hypothetical protein EB051_02245 [Chlamydiia bacterium]|nr:hypothetical protein [Chlamydiia bacterium]
MLSGFAFLDHILEHNAAEPADLNQLLSVLSELGNPQYDLRAVHIAGSNGKGSVCCKIAQSLELAGYCVGLFTSPHIHCYTERIQICGEAISKSQVEEGLRKISEVAAFLGVTLNYFQYTTLLSVLYFKDRQVDVVVVETGIGGRLDATRVYDPILSVITSISLEHTQLLGACKELIGQEKAGICKKNTPLVLGPRACISSIFSVAHKLKCPILLAPLVDGSYDMENQQIAKVALEHLQGLFRNLTDYCIAQGIESKPACRMEKIGSFIFDVAHNPDAFIRLFEGITSYLAEQKIVCMIGMSSDKDIQSCLSIAAKYCGHIVLVEADGLRPACRQRLADLLDAAGYFNYTVADSIPDGIKRMQKHQNVIHLVCGSFYIMDEAKKALYMSYPLNPSSTCSSVGLLSL